MSQLGQGAPTPRRSVRLASVASRSQGAPSTIVTTTPVQPRSTNRRKSALPEVKSRQSNAYGASGRLGAAEVLAVPLTGFTQAFEDQRDTAVARDEDRVSVRSSQRSSPSPSHESMATSHQSASVSVEPETINDGQLRPRSRYLQQKHTFAVPGPRFQRSPSPEASANTTKSFGLVHEGGVIDGNGVVPKAAARSTNAHDTPNASGQAFEFPGWLQQWLTLDSLKALLLILGGVFLAGLFLSSGFSPAANDAASSDVSMYRAVSSRFGYTWDSIKFKVMPQFPNISIDTTYDIISGRVSKLEHKANDFNASIDRLLKHLPHTIAVPRNSKGELQIPDDFWRAMSQKIKSEGLKDPSITRDADWIDFMNKNEAKIRKLVSQEINAQGATKLNYKNVDREEFAALMRKEYQNIERAVDKQFAELSNSLSKNHKKELRAALKDSKAEIDKLVLDEVRIQSMAVANLVANADVALRKINFFSPGYGVRVNPYETSPTLSQSSSWFSFSSRRPPLAALEKWEEPGDCWCAAPSESKPGLAQLSVTLANSVFPSQVTVEHLPAAASLDVGSAPKDMELWAEVPDAQSIPNAPGCSETGPRGFVCLGQFAYNIHADNHVQTFGLDVDVTGLAPVSRVVVRVTSNWGSDHTCIYRLRLHGAPA